MDTSLSIVGTWRLPSGMVEGEEEFMHIGEDGRIVHFVYTDSSGRSSVPMMLWFESLGHDQYLIRVRPGNEAGTVSMMIPTATGMTIDGHGTQFHLVPTSESELPDWYAHRLEKALIRMSERDVESEEAEQDGDAKRE